MRISFDGKTFCKTQFDTVDETHSRFTEKQDLKQNFFLLKYQQKAKLTTKRLNSYPNWKFQWMRGCNRARKSQRECKRKFNFCIWHIVKSKPYSFCRFDSCYNWRAMPSIAPTVDVMESTNTGFCRIWLH